MDSFNHEVLGDVSDETRWLKIFTTKDLIRLSVTAMICILMLNILPKTGFFICLEIMIFLGMCIRVLLGLIKKHKDKFLTGGGISIYDVYERKRYFKKVRNGKRVEVYTLGVEEEDETEV